MEHNVLVRFLGLVSKVVGGIIALVIAISFISPPWGDRFELWAAQRLGTHGHVFYQVDDDGNLNSKDARLFLLRSGQRDFASLERGDKLQANAPTNFRERESKDSPTLFILQKGDCVTILEVGSAYQTEELSEGGSGGWLRVATSSCGLFG